MSRKSDAAPVPEPEPSFEHALERLEAIVDELEGGQLSLEQSLSHYEEGMKLSKRLSRTLDEAEKVIERLVDANGEEAGAPDAGAEHGGRAGSRPVTRPMELELDPGKGGDSELPL